jgi:cystathionine beta-lyase
MTFDFDTPPERRGTDSQKWQKYAGKDILPLWVADMDFAVAPAIVEALQRRLGHPIFGYARPARSTVDAVVEALERNYGWKIDPAWLVWLPGLVAGLNVAVRAFADPGDEVLCLSPVYPPFTLAPKYGDRVSRSVPLVLAGARWEIDWDALEAAVSPRTRLFLLCHPHNPVARVWTPAELVRLAEFCARHSLILCSDEIHCDLILDAATRHLPAAVAAPAAAGGTVTMMAPSKTYNIPGLGTAFAVMPDHRLRARFAKTAAGILAEVNVLGYGACEAAYRDGGPWRQALLTYLRGNRDLLADYVARELPGVRIEAPIEATYLAWMNVSALGLADPMAHFEAHGVGLSDGVPFGGAPGRYVRLNFGCARSTLVEALARMKSALAAR